MKAADLEGYLARQAKAPEPDPFWLITGTDEFLAVEAGDAVRRTMRAMGYGDRQVLDMTGNADWSRLTMAAADIGMFDDRKIVEVRLPGSKPGTQGASALTAYVEKPISGVVTIFAIPTPDWSAAKAAWWQTLNKKCTVVDCSAVERRQLPQWLARRMARHGQSAAPDTLEFFADLIEGNLFAAAQEIEKLSLLFPKGELTREQIQSSVANSSRFELETLFESMKMGEADRIVRIIDGLEAQNEALPFLLVMLTQEIRSILKLRTGYDQGMSRVPGVFATPSLQRAARRLSVKKLSNALLVCAEIDRLAKGLPVPKRDSDPWIELKSVVLFLAR